MDLDPKAFAELRASLAAQKCPAFERLAALADATLGRALPQGMGEPGRTYTARDCLDGIRRAQGGRE